MRPGVNMPGCFGHAILIFAAGPHAPYKASSETCSGPGYVRGVFLTGHDAASRPAFKAETAGASDLVDFALGGLKEDIDKAIT